MSKNEMMRSVDDYIQITNVFLVGAYNHVENIKKVLKKNDVHIKLSLNLAQVNIGSGIRTLDSMIKRLKEEKNG